MAFNLPLFVAFDLNVIQPLSGLKVSHFKTEQTIHIHEDQRIFSVDRKWAN